MELCKENGDECKTCTGTNCNSQKMFRRCLHCSTNECRQCAINPQLAKSKKCAKYNDKCYTFIDEFSVSRGCATERDDDSFEESCEKDSDKCQICETPDDDSNEGCNNQPIMMETCVACNSNKEGSECLTNPIKYKDKVCSGIETENRTGCYLRIVSIVLARIAIL